MPNYKYGELRAKFTAQYNKEKIKSTKIAWDFCKRYHIKSKASKARPAQWTVYKWYHSLEKTL